LTLAHVGLVAPANTPREIIERAEGMLVPFLCKLRAASAMAVKSRTGHECGAQLPAIAAALRTLPVRSVIQPRAS
jgi:hypothetical protein